MYVTSTMACTVPNSETPLTPVQLASSQARLDNMNNAIDAANDRMAALIMRDAVPVASAIPVYAQDPGVGGPAADGSPNGIRPWGGRNRNGGGGGLSLYGGTGTAGRWSGPGGRWGASSPGGGASVAGSGPGSPGGGRVGRGYVVGPGGVLLPAGSSGGPTGPGLAPQGGVAYQDKWQAAGVLADPFRGNLAGRRPFTGGSLGVLRVNPHAVVPSSPCWGDPATADPTGLDDGTSGLTLAAILFAVVLGAAAA